MSRFFRARREDFVCEQCGVAVPGDGYTNHCPECLFSKHVDINPGDRANSCRSLMTPVRLELIKGKFVLTHECQKCGVLKSNRAARGDLLAPLIGKSDAVILEP